MRWSSIVKVISGLLVLGCVPIEPSECGGIRDEERCVDADVEFGTCHWVEVIEPTVVDGACAADPPSHGQCIGLTGTQQGCGPIACPGQDDPPNAFFRERDGSIEVFVNPECGPQPAAGGWSACGQEPGTPAECSCACGS